MSRLCIVQARMESNRLPGKVLAEIGGMPMLGKIFCRLERSRMLDGVVLATSTSAADNSLEELARDHGVPTVRGSELDVLERFRTVVNEFPSATTLVRVTADCPFVDPGIIDQLILTHEEHHNDYTSNRLPPPSARTYPVGLDAECFSAELLRRASERASAPYEREHVTPWMYQSYGGRVEVINLPEDLSRYRWTVDTLADLQLVRHLHRLTGPEPYTWQEVLATARRHPELLELNGAIPQKPVDAIDSRWVRDVQYPR